MSDRFSYRGPGEIYDALVAGRAAPPEVPVPPGPSAPHPIAADPVAADPVAADPVGADPVAADPAAPAAGAAEPSVGFDGGQALLQALQAAQQQRILRADQALVQRIVRAQQQRVEQIVRASGAPPTAADPTNGPDTVSETGSGPRRSDSSD